MSFGAVHWHRDHDWHDTRFEGTTLSGDIMSTCRCVFGNHVGLSQPQALWFWKSLSFCSRFLGCFHIPRSCCSDLLNMALNIQSSRDGWQPGCGHRCNWIHYCCKSLLRDSRTGLWKWWSKIQPLRIWRCTPMARTASFRTPTTWASVVSAPLGKVANTIGWESCRNVLDIATRWGKWSMRIGGSMSARQTKRNLMGSVASPVALTSLPDLKTDLTREFSIWTSNRLVTALMPYIRWFRMGGSELSMRWEPERAEGSSSKWSWSIVVSPETIRLFTLRCEGSLAACFRLLELLQRLWWNSATPSKRFTRWARMVFCTLAGTTGLRSDNYYFSFSLNIVK